MVTPEESVEKGHPKRTYQPWSAYEEGVVRDLRVKLSSRSLATRLKRSVVSVETKARRLGVEADDNETLDATQIGQLVGLAKSTISRRVQDGHILADQTGHGSGYSYRIRKGVMASIDMTQGSNREKDAKGCLNCGNSCEGQSTTHCSQRCKSEYIPGMIFPAPLRVGFQRWLEQDAKILITQAPSLRGESFWLREQELLTDGEARIAGVLMGDFPRRIVPWQFLARVVSDQPLSHTEVTKQMKALKQKLLNPPDIFSLEDQGWGVGIQSLALSFDQVRLLRQFWQRERSFINRGYLIRNTFGSLSEDAYSLFQATFDTLNKQLTDTPYAITAKEWRGKQLPAYKLERRIVYDYFRH